MKLKRALQALADNPDGLTTNQLRRKSFQPLHDPAFYLILDSLATQTGLNTYANRLIKITPKGIKALEQHNETS